MVMYYNRKLVEEENLGSFDTLLDSGLLSFPVAGWHTGSFFMAAGGKLGGESGRELRADMEITEQQYDHFRNKLMDIYKHPNFRDGQTASAWTLLPGGILLCCSKPAGKVNDSVEN